MTEEWVSLGAEDSFRALPARITVGVGTYYLIRQNESYNLLSAACPHQGGTVEQTVDGFKCPSHGWCFGPSGDCLNTPELPLLSYPVKIQNGHLFSPISNALVSPTHSQTIQGNLVECDIKLHAHACVEFNHKEFSLLTDPWLVGPAFLGAWIQYPHSAVDISNLKPNAIWISHEHSDHFHEPTLKMLDHSTPVYVPDFPNRRMVNRLTKMGFSDIHPMAFGETYNISNDIKLTCFEPGGLWNDSIVLIEIGKFRYLNLNDAGLNQRIANQVAPVNVVASGFSPGASGYPLTWNHLTDDRKIEIQEQGRKGCIELLKEAMELYGGEYLFPMASHFALWHPSHMEYSRLSRKNSVLDVVAAFEHDDIRVIDLLPGESWEVHTEKITRIWQDRELLYARDSYLEHLPNTFDQKVFQEHYPTPMCPSREIVEAYLLKLNQVPEIIFCDELTASIEVTETGNENQEFRIAIKIQSGQLSILSELPKSPNLTIEIPGGILQKIITEDLSWDEAHIGYWCRFSRSPDIYHAGFWRLLQAPYFKKSSDDSKQSYKSVTAESIIGDLIEEFGDQASRILRRYGLYCTGCEHSTWCSISESGKVHGIPKARIDQLAQEISVLSIG